MSEQTIHTLSDEARRFPPPPAFAATAKVGAEVYDEPFEAFWERNGRERVSWFEPFGELYQWELPYAQWYLGGNSTSRTTASTGMSRPGSASAWRSTGRKSPQATGARSPTRTCSVM